MNAPTLTQPAAVVRLERVLPGPIERVWRYLTESALRRTWLAEGEMELVPGGKVQLTWFNDTLSDEPTPERFVEDEGYSMTGAVLACEAPRMLAFTWPQRSGLTEVRFELEPRGADVVLRVVHSNLTARAQRINVSAGWDAHVGVLQQRLAGIEPVVFWANFARAEAEYQARL